MVYGLYNNIAVVSWQFDLLVEETWVPGENRQTLLQNVVSVHLVMDRVWTHNVTIDRHWMHMQL
jgi:hypothetical protein